jgi:hypothetical protein
VDGDLVATRARLARLTAEEGTDFNGMLSAAEIANIVTLAAKASQDEPDPAL